MKTIVLNFGHPLSDVAQQQITQLFPSGVIIQNIKVSVDMESTETVGAQMQTLLLDSVPSEALNGTAPIAVVLPGMAIAAVAVTAILHGTTGSFPRVIELRPKDGVFQLHLLHGIQELRNSSRNLR